MIYVAIDLETSGLYPGIHQILEFGAVLEDMITPVDQLPIFHKYVLSAKGSYNCQPTAIIMNIDIMKKINEYNWKIPENDPEQPHPFVRDDLLVGEFLKWLKSYGIIENEEAPGYINVGGKNFMGFDYPFIKALQYGNKIKIRRRIIDPAPLYFDPAVDADLPDLQTCLDRAGITKTVLHTAVEDSIDVIKLFRHKFGIPF